MRAKVAGCASGRITVCNLTGCPMNSRCWPRPYLCKNQMMVKRSDQSTDLQRAVSSREIFRGLEQEPHPLGTSKRVTRRPHPVRTFPAARPKTFSRQVNVRLSPENSPSFPARLTTETLALAARHLAQRDPHLASIYKSHGVPPMWGRRPGFSTLLRIILEQQVSLVSARSMFERLKANVHPFTAEGFIDAGEAQLRSLGVTRQKAHYCVQVAEAFTHGHLQRIARMSDEEAHAALVSIKGVGPWTANIYLLMALKRPDIWPDGDIALASAAGKVLNMSKRPSFGELAGIAEAWRPYRSVAARMLWNFYLEEREASKKLKSGTTSRSSTAQSQIYRR